MSKSKFKFNGEWQLEFTFEAFSGLQSRRGDYGALSSKKPSKGKICLTIQDALNEDFDPKKSQIKSIEYLIDNHLLINEALINSLPSYYESQKELFGFDPDDPNDVESFPIISKNEDFKNIFGIANVFVLTADKDNYAYIGLEGGCSWGGEHGIGFLIHKDKIIKVGDADTSTDYQAAYKDNGTFKQREKERNLKSKKPTKPVYYEPHPKFGTLKPNQIYANKMYPNKLIETGHNEDFKLLVEIEVVDINHNPGLSISYLQNAVQSNNLEICKYIFSLNPKDTSNVIQATAGKMNKAIVDLCLEYELDINELSANNDTLFDRAKGQVAYWKKRDAKKCQSAKDFMKYIKSKGAKDTASS